MYSQFVNLSCQAERELNQQYNIAIGKHQQNIQSQCARLKGPMVLKQPAECSGIKTNMRFCDRPIENEMIPRARNNNGNSQRMFMFDTKNREVRSCGIVGWIDAIQPLRKKAIDPMVSWQCK
jgi:hypothetical protein